VAVAVSVTAILLLGAFCIVSWDVVPNWLTALAAVIGLVLVYLQLRGLNDQAKLQTYGEYTRRYAEIAARFPEDVNSPGFELAGRADYDIVMRAMRAYFDLCFEEWDLHSKGLVDRRFWDTWKDGIETAMSKAAFRQAWPIVQMDTVFGEDFVAFLEAAMRSPPPVQ
jgi:hypothetical protein